MEEAETMSDGDDKALPDIQQDQGSLEQAIDLMEESNGACFDPTNFHSFRAVSFLIPLRTCAVCSQRLKSVARFTSYKVVQCAACSILAHRSCALSKTTQWPEPCPVNYKELHPDEATSPDPRTSDNVLDDATDKDSDQKEGIPCSSSSSAEGSSPNNDSSETPISGAITTETDTSLDQHEKLSTHEGEALLAESSDVPVVTPVKSDDPIVNERTFSKATFSFLSSSPFHRAKSDMPSCYSSNVDGSSPDNDSSETPMSGTMPTEMDTSSEQHDKLSNNEGEALLAESSDVPAITSVKSDDSGVNERTFSKATFSFLSASPFRRAKLDVPSCASSNVDGSSPNNDSSATPMSGTMPTETDTSTKQHDKLSNHEGEALLAESSDVPAITSVKSDDSGVNETTFSKATFSFLSSSPFHRTKSVTTAGSAYSNSERADEDSPIKRSQTWSNSSPSSSFAEGTTAGTKEINHEENLKVSQIHPLDSIPSSPNSWEPDEQEKHQDDDDDKSTQSLEWTVDGPPVHWASASTVAKIFPQYSFEQALDVGMDSFAREENPIQFAIHSFATVSRTLQENIPAIFLPVVVDRLLNNEAAASDDVQYAAQDTAESSDGNSTKSATHADDCNNLQEADVEGLLEETQSNIPDQRRLGLATVAGGIAGGVAGLVIAGPMGGVIGVKFGQTAGILGLVLEGSFTLGVITSGIAAGRHAGEQLQEKLSEKRVLTLSGTGKNQGILLVRPNVKIDPEWEVFCENARHSHHRGLFSFLPRDSKATNRERYERVVDIVTTDEIEIPTADKVLLLVSRNLNNKDSLPGHVYRQLLEKLKERTASRGSIEEILKLMPQSKEGSVEHSSERSSTDLIRARRHDAHAVIKHVTATLLEVRPGFAVSAAMTEYTATAVEALVFGEIYDLVMEEIEAELNDKDNNLLVKVAAFEEKQAQGESGHENYKAATSEGAVQALHKLPEAHSPVDKLRYCVQFLEKISDYFSAEQSSKQAAMGADSLLKLVCQHILVAKVHGIHAQIAFLDEFARDEHLLRGKEGYALVTLQASLHFLDASSDFNADIFEQDDD